MKGLFLQQRFPPTLSSRHRSPDPSPVFFLRSWSFRAERTWDLSGAMSLGCLAKLDHSPAAVQLEENPDTSAHRSG